MKNCSWLIGCCGFALMLGPSYAQETLTAAQMNSVVKMDLNACSAGPGKMVPATVIPASMAKAFPQDRIEKTLNGVWRGKVTGAYPKQFLAKDGDLNVDYFWVIDTKRGEALIVEQFSSKRTIAASKTLTTAPSWSFMMCGGEQYVPQHPRQIHEFQKVSDNIEDARGLVMKSTGLKASVLKMDAAATPLSSLWQDLVATKYFDGARYRAYAGGLFKPFKFGQVANATGSGPALFSMEYEGEYRGGGATAAKFTTGVPIRGVESAQFTGLSTGGGDFLIASPGNGKAWKKTATQGGAIDLQFDKVVIGPLAQ